MKEQSLEELSPDMCTAKIFEISGEKFAPEIGVDLWPKILKHKMIEKLHKDCITYSRA